MQRTWREQSAAHIHATYAEIKAEKPELTNDQILKVVSKEHYPFGKREYYAYKAWLLAMKDARKTLGVSNANDSKRQLPLFS